MGYFGNNLATLVTGVFAATLTGLWPYFIDFAPITKLRIHNGSSNYMVYDIYMLDFSEKYRLHA